MGTVSAPFPYAADGFTVELLKVGDERDFGPLEAGLIEAGLVAGEVEPTTQTDAKPRTPRPSKRDT